MRRLWVGLLLLGAASADSRIDRMEAAFRNGDADAALYEATGEVMDLLVNWDDRPRTIYHAIIAHNDARARKDPAACEKALAFARKIAAHALARRGSEAGARIVAAEASIVEGRHRLARRDKEGFEGWRTAARALAEWHSGDADRTRALVRAVEILAEGAARKGAPAQEMLDEARATALKDARGESYASPAWAAYQLAVARATRNRKLLEPFREVRAELTKPAPDLDLATVYHEAVAAGLDAEPVTWTFEAARLAVDLPVSRLWSTPKRGLERGALIQRRSPDGRVLRQVFLIYRPPGVPFDVNKPAPKDAKEYANLYMVYPRMEFTDLKKNTKPKRKKLNGHIRNSVACDLEGPAKQGQYEVQRYFFFEGRKRKKALFGVWIHAFGKKPPPDPAFDAALATIRES